jgi:hypothetical protein
MTYCLRVGERGSGVTPDLELRSIISETPPGQQRALLGDVCRRERGRIMT